MPLTSTFPESRVIQIWQEQLPDRTDLVTEDGESIKVVYPGRVNGDRGADLIDAVITTSHGLLKGDIEVHVKSSGWRAHGHHRDANYNRVILHVVYWRDTETATNLQNGREIPTLVLNKYVESPADWHTNLPRPLTGRYMPCRNSPVLWSAGMMWELLDNAGEERFLSKAAAFQDALAQVGASQSLYRGIMEALGYTKNKLPLRELAHRMPLHRLEMKTSGAASGVACLAQKQALLLGTAGLLPSQRSRLWLLPESDAAWIDALEKTWASSRQAGAMCEGDWYLFKVRPSNFPARRIAAMSYLLVRYQERGLLKELVDRLREVPVDGGHRRLEKALLVFTSDYWASHLDFGLPSRRGTPALVGSGRAADIVVNVLLPFAFAWGKFTSQPGLASKARELYYHYPRLAINAVERHMRSQLRVSRYLVNSAQRQQGLMHIYKTLCSQGKCRSCRIGGLGASG